MVGEVGFEPTNPKDLIYSQAALTRFAYSPISASIAARFY